MAPVWAASAADWPSVAAAGVSRMAVGLEVVAAVVAAVVSEAGVAAQVWGGGVGAPEKTAVAVWAAGPGCRSRGG